jgi:hypothetical protein
MAVWSIGNERYGSGDRFFGSPEFVLSAVPILG